MLVDGKGALYLGEHALERGPLPCVQAPGDVACGGQQVLLAARSARLLSPLQPQARSERVNFRDLCLKGSDACRAL